MRCHNLLIKTKIKAKWNANLTEAQIYAGRAVDRDLYLDMISMITEPAMAKGYRMRMERRRRVDI